MNKEEFMSLLRARLAGLPQYDIDRSADYYSEMIDDRMEDGMSEYEAVRAVGSVDEAVEQILSSIPLAKIATQRVKPKRAIQWREIVLLIFGAPLWITILLAAVGVFFSVYITIWSVVIAMFAVVASLAATAVFGVIRGALSAASGQLWQGVFYVGAGIACAGLTVFALYISVSAAKWIAGLSKRFVLWVKSLFIGRGNGYEQL